MGLYDDSLTFIRDIFKTIVIKIINNVLLDYSNDLPVFRSCKLFDVSNKVGALKRYQFGKKTASNVYSVRKKQ